jgi:hypothetical protein
MCNLCLFIKNEVVNEVINIQTSVVFYFLTLNVKIFDHTIPFPLSNPPKCTLCNFIIKLLTTSADINLNIFSSIKY